LAPVTSAQGSLRVMRVKEVHSVAMQGLCGCRLMRDARSYRTTIKLVTEGVYEFWNWFDAESWHPLGRVVGGTVYPGLMLTAGAMYKARSEHGRAWLHGQCNSLALCACLLAALALC
jgi:hypothetical protein